MCHTYAAMKKEDSVHVAERKIVSVKFLINGDTDERDVFTKAMIKKVYGNWSRPAAIKFQQNIPRKDCPFVASSLCCHVLALSLFGRHYHDTGGKKLELK